jgi:cell wall-associated NlpC family hydrolase
LPHDFIIENYERIPRNNFLVKFLDRLLDRVEGDLCKGDILMFRKSGVNGHVGIYLGDSEYIHADSINGVIKTYIHEYPPALIYRVPTLGVVK